MLKRKTKKGSEDVTGGMILGAPRKPKEELIRSITINLKQKVLDRIAEEGEPKKVIERIITQLYPEK